MNFSYFCELFELFKKKRELFELNWIKPPVPPAPGKTEPGTGTGSWHPGGAHPSLCDRLLRTLGVTGSLVCETVGFTQRKRTNWWPQWICRFADSKILAAGQRSLSREEKLAKGQACWEGDQHLLPRKKRSFQKAKKLFAQPAAFSTFCSSSHAPWACTQAPEEHGRSLYNWLLHSLDERDLGQTNAKCYPEVCLPSFQEHENEEH